MQKKGRHFATHEFVHGKDINKQYVTNIETKCRHFKDKNKIIELPCKVGDKIFYVSFGKNYESECVGINIRKDATHIILYDFDGDTASYTANRVFLTKEEAEKALQKGSEV